MRAHLKAILNYYGTLLRMTTRKIPRKDYQYILDPIVNRLHRFVLCVLASGCELLNSPMSDLVWSCQIIIILYIIIMNQEYNDFRTPILIISNYLELLSNMVDYYWHNNPNSEFTVNY